MGPVTGPVFSSEGVKAMSQSVAVTGIAPASTDTAAAAADGNEASLAVTTLAVAITFVVAGVPMGIFFALLT
jgi:hypothetical protein